MDIYNPKAKAITQKTDYATDGDGTSIRIVISIYDEPIFEHGEPKMYSEMELFIIGNTGSGVGQYYGKPFYYPDKLIPKQMEEIMQYAKTNVDNFKYPTPKKVTDD